MRKRTLKAYTDLYRNPRAMFPPTASSAGVEVILFPNGEREIWIKDDTGKGFRIKAGRGPHGLGLQIGRFTCGPVMTINGYAGPQGAPEVKGVDVGHLEICQYDEDASAQAYKEWYAGRGEYPGDKAAGYPADVCKDEEDDPCEGCGTADGEHAERCRMVCAHEWPADLHEDGGAHYCVKCGADGLA